MRIEFTRTARKQMAAGLSYIHRDKPSAARMLKERIHSGVRTLLVYPESGRSITEFPDLPYRELLVSPFRIFYRTTPECLYVVAIWHEAQIPGMPEHEFPSV